MSMKCHFGLLSEEVKMFYLKFSDMCVSMFSNDDASAQRRGTFSTLLKTNCREVGAE